MRILPLLLLMLSASCAGKHTPEAEAEGVDELTRMVLAGAITDLNGASVDLAAYKGKVVMLDFWETWCVPCIRSFPGMDRAVREYPDEFAVIAISPGFSDTDADISGFVTGVDYRFTWAKGADLATELGVQGIPYKVFLDKDGNVQAVEVGSRGPDRDYEKLVELILSSRK
jgi:thiol-disulfide isomerase/thioredoxin